MENRYPLFAGGRILKKESLWDLRDYVYRGWQLHYTDYTDGVIKGCRVKVEGSNLIVEEGMMKYQDFLYLLGEEVRIPITAENRMAVLKASFEVKKGHSDYFTYEVNFFLDYSLERKENQIELCRFHLREGSVLRDTYINFYDMGTEYDTINLIYATVAGKRRRIMHPDILQQYAREMHLLDTKDIADKLFCYHIFQQQGKIQTDLLDAYLYDKKIETTGLETGTDGNRVYFEHLAKILSCHGEYNNDRNVPKKIFIE